MKPSGGKAGTDPWYLQRKLPNNPHEPFDVFTAMRVPTMFGKLLEDYSINKNPKTYNAAENSVVSLTSGPGAQCWELHDLTCAGKKQKVCRHGLPGDPTGGSQWAWYFNQKSGSGIGRSYGWSDENTYTKIWIRGTKPIDMQRYRSCADIKQYHPHSKNGIYEVNLKSGPQYVQCDMERV